MTQGTVEDLIHLPAAPIYIFFMGISFALLWGAAKETLERVGIIKLRGVAFPAAPSQFGTAPAWLVPSLSDIRFHPSHVDPSARADEHTGPTVASAVQPRLLYLIVLWIASLPLPLLTFGTGSFLNSFWWSATPAAILVLILTEWMISKGEKEVQSLSGLKYSYKGA